MQPAPASDRPVRVVAAEIRGFAASLCPRSEPKHQKARAEPRPRRPGRRRRLPRARRWRWRRPSARSAAAAPSRRPQPEIEIGISMVKRISGTSAAVAARPGRHRRRGRRTQRRRGCRSWCRCSADLARQAVRAASAVVKGVPELACARPTAPARCAAPGKTGSAADRKPKGWRRRQAMGASQGRRAWPVSPRRPRPAG
jgi:hypothetical protein